MRTLEVVTVYTLDSKANSDSVPVQLIASIAGIVARVADLSLRDPKRLIRVILCNIRAWAELNLLAVPQPQDLQLATLHFVGGSVAVQNDVTADNDCLTDRRLNDCCLVCLSAHTHAHNTMLNVRLATSHILSWDMTLTKTKQYFLLFRPRFFLSSPLFPALPFLPIPSLHHPPTPFHLTL